jgi:hypothetical protein
VGCALLEAGAMDLRPAPGVKIPKGPAEPPEVVDGEDDDHAGAFERSEEELICPAHIASEFGLFVWWRAAEGRGKISLGEHGDAEFWPDGRIDFRLPGEEKTFASVGGENPAQSAVALAALAEGAVVKAFGLTVRREDREYTLRLSGPLLHWSGVKLPALVKGGDEGEGLYEAAFLYEELHFILSHLFATFAKQRAAVGWTEQGGMALRRWLGLELGRKLGPDQAAQMWLFPGMAA